MDYELMCVSCAVPQRIRVEEVPGPTEDRIIEGGGEVIDSHFRVEKEFAMRMIDEDTKVYIQRGYYLSTHQTTSRTPPPAPYLSQKPQKRRVHRRCLPIPPIPKSREEGYQVVAIVTRKPPSSSLSALLNTNHALLIIPTILLQAPAQRTSGPPAPTPCPSRELPNRQTAASRAQQHHAREVNVVLPNQHNGRCVPAVPAARAPVPEQRRRHRPAQHVRVHVPLCISEDVRLLALRAARRHERALVAHPAVGEEHAARAEHVLDVGHAPEEVSAWNSREEVAQEAVAGAGEDEGVVHAGGVGAGGDERDGAEGVEGRETCDVHVEVDAAEVVEQGVAEDVGALDALAVVVVVREDVWVVLCHEVVRVLVRP